MVDRITTVITPAPSYDLVTLQDLVDDLAITTTDDDAYLMRAISKASLAAAQYCDRVLVNEYVQDRFEFGWKSAGGSLKLSHYPVTQLQSITQGDVVLVEGTDFTLDAATGVLYRADCEWAGDALVVEYEGGYVDIPLDLQGAVTDIVKALQFNRTRDPLLRSENILSGLYAYTLFDASNVSAGTAQQVRGTLDSYRVISV